MNIISKFKKSNFDKAVDLLIKENKQNRDKNKKNVKGISDVLYLISLCTVHCNIGRGTGKTNYIGTHATTDDIIVVPNFYLKKPFLKKHGQHMENNIFAINQLEKIRGLAFSNVYVDEPALCFKNYDKVEFYRDIARSGGEHTIIMFGE